MLQCTNVRRAKKAPDQFEAEFGTLSKQLTVSIALSVTMMSAFAVFATTGLSSDRANGHENGAIAEATAPSIFNALFK